MGPFMKAAKSGLAKTVAAGQQHLQQRLSKYEQSQSQSQSRSGGNSYSSGQHHYGQQPASYARNYGNQNQGHDQYHGQPYQSRMTAAQHSPYFAPSPTSTTPQAPHCQHGHLSTGQQQSCGNATTTANPPGRSSRATGPHGQGQYTSYGAPPPPRAYQQPAPSNSPPPPASQNDTATRLLSNTSLGPPSPQPPTYMQPGPDAHGSPVPPPLPPRIDYPKPQPRPQPQPQPEPLSQAEHPDPNHWTNRLRRAQESTASFIAPHRPDAGLNGSSVDAQAGCGNRPPASSAANSSDGGFSRPLANQDGHVRIPPPLLPGARPAQSQAAAAAITPSGYDQAYATSSTPSGYDQAYTTNSTPSGYDQAYTTDSTPSGYNQAYTTDFTTGSNHKPQPSASDDPEAEAEAIAQTMSILRIENEQQGPAQSSPERAPPPNPRARKLPPVVASGTAREVVRECPEDRVVDYPLYWYQLPDEPEFLICTKCHQDHIRSTHLEGQFTRILAAPESQSTCRFWSPRVKDRLWKHALQTNQMEHLGSFIKRRLSIPNCKGQAIVTDKDKIKWFGMVNGDVSGFIVCEACHEDKIVGTAFQSQFTPYKDQGPNDEWTCDAALPCIARAVEKMCKTDDWAGLVSIAQRRMAYPACEGKDISWNEGVWFTPRRRLDNFYVCGACYMDKLETTPFAHEFESVSTAVSFDAWMSMLGTRWTCKLPSSNIPMSFVLGTYLTDMEDFDGFCNMAAVINQLVPCTKHGIIRGNWWTIAGAGGCPDFSICEACYHGVFKTMKLDHFLEPATRSPDDSIVCSFCPAGPRFNQYMRRFAEALDRSVFSYYSDYVKAFASVPTCPRLGTRANATWWGYDQVLFCQDCHLSFVADTPVGNHLQYYDASDERAQICQMWSPRMRRMWLQVCEAGDAGSEASNDALDKFKAFGKRRLRVFLQTVPRIEFIRAAKEMKMMNAMHQGQLSLMYSGMNSMAVLSGTTDGYAHGNSSLGWYETENGATGAQMFDNMQAGFADANRMDEWAQMLQLQMMWSEVE